jgi:hypothetical protein
MQISQITTEKDTVFRASSSQALFHDGWRVEREIVHELIEKYTKYDAFVIFDVLIDS